MFHSYVSFWLILLFLLKIVMRTIENWDHVPLHIIEKYRECDFSGINFGFAESNFSNLMQMWGKCVKQTAGILRWMDRVHLLGHSEVGRVGKNTNPKKSGRIQISAEVDQFKGRKGGEGRERQNWILQKPFFLSLKALATEEGGENVWGLAARLLRSLGMHGVGDGARCTLYIIHCTSNTAQCTLRWSGLWVAWD